MTPLRQRDSEDLQLRNSSPKTPPLYVECVSLFARYFPRSPELLGPEHIRAYQLYRVQEQKSSWSRFNQTVCALRFLYRVTLQRFPVACTTNLAKGNHPMQVSSTVA